LPDAFPLRRRLRRTPPVLAKRRRGEGYSLEDAHIRLAGAEGALEKAGFDPHLLRNHGGGVRDGRDKRCGGEKTFDSLHVFSFFGCIMRSAGLYEICTQILHLFHPCLGNAEFRIIPTDGREHAPRKAIEATYMGYTIEHWKALTGLFDLSLRPCENSNPRFFCRKIRNSLPRVASTLYTNALRWVAGRQKLGFSSQRASRFYRFL
jgi:hypothetical protein